MPHKVPAHPPGSPSDTAVTRENIANVYCKQGKHAEALELYMQVLAVRKKVLGLAGKASRGAQGTPKVAGHQDQDLWPGPPGRGRQPEQVHTCHTHTCISVYVYP